MDFSSVGCPRRGVSMDREAPRIRLTALGRTLKGKFRTLLSQPVVTDFDPDVPVLHHPNSTFSTTPVTLPTRELIRCQGTTPRRCSGCPYSRKMCDLFRGQRLIERPEVFWINTPVPPSKVFTLVPLERYILQGISLGKRTGSVMERFTRRVSTWGRQTYTVWEKDPP